MDVYDLAGACASVRLYLEGLTNWYIRRSRQRFWDGDPDAIDTLHTVLEVLCRVVAPLLPLTTEVIWRGLDGRPLGAPDRLADGRTSSPRTPSWSPRWTRSGRSRRSRCRCARPPSCGSGSRWPSLTVATRNADRLRPFVSLLADEVNVRQVELTELADGDDRVSRQLSVNARAAGPRLGRDVQKVIKASKAGDWTVGDDGAVVCGGFALVEGEYTLELVATGSSSDAVGLLRSGGFVSLDTVLDDDLLADGAVSDLLRLVQQARKDAGLEVSDRIASHPRRAGRAVGGGAGPDRHRQGRDSRARGAARLDRRRFLGAGRPGRRGDCQLNGSRTRIPSNRRNPRSRVCSRPVVVSGMVGEGVGQRPQGGGAAGVDPAAGQRVAPGDAAVDDHDRHAVAGGVPDETQSRTSLSTTSRRPASPAPRRPSRKARSTRSLSARSRRRTPHAA